MKLAIAIAPLAPWGMAMGANQIATGTMTQIAEKMARHGTAPSSRAGVVVTVVAGMSVALMRPSLSSLKATDCGH